jgi:hypothetical protein
LPQPQYTPEFISFPLITQSEWKFLFQRVFEKERKTVFLFHILNDFDSYIKNIIRDIFIYEQKSLWKFVVFMKRSHTIETICNIPELHQKCARWISFTPKMLLLPVAFSTHINLNDFYVFIAWASFNIYFKFYLRKWPVIPKVLTWSCIIVIWVLYSCFTIHYISRNKGSQLMCLIL